MNDKTRVIVHKGPYATVRAIEKALLSSLCLSDASAISRLGTPVGAHIIAETERCYIYEVWATEGNDSPVNVCT